MELDPEALKNLSPEQMHQALAAIKQQSVLAHLQSLVTSLNDKCVTKCISSPGSSLSGSETQCLQRCTDRFIESWDYVSKTLQARYQKDSLKNGSRNLDSGSSLSGLSFS